MDVFGGSVPAAAVPTPPPRRFGADVRRTERQRQIVLDGMHPLTGGRLHPDAPRDATDAHAAGLRCGSCAHRVLRSAGGKAWPKCRAYHGRYLTNGAATDVRAWWPACPAYDRRP